MRLLLLTSTVTTGNGPFYRITYLDKNKYTITVVCYGYDQNTLETVVREWVGSDKMKELRLIGLGAKTRLDVRPIIRLWRILRFGHFDIVQTSHSYVAEIGILLSKLAKIPRGINHHNCQTKTSHTPPGRVTPP